MGLELHVWGPAFGLPSIDAECIATISYFHRIVPRTQWSLVADYDTSLSPQHEFPLLVDGNIKLTGFSSIVSYLRNHRSGAYDLEYHLTHQQQTDKTAFISFLRSTAAPLVDLSLYISSENYNSVTSSAYTSILPWYTNYTVPPARRVMARARTAHLGLSSLDVTTAVEESRGPGSGTASSEFKSAKKLAGVTADNQTNQPAPLNMGRGKGIGGLLGSPMYAARFKLDALSKELLEPLADLLGKTDYLLEGDKPSSLDCLAFGYLSLMFYPAVPQAWLKETIQTKYPRILRYVRRLRDEFGGEETNPAQVWAISVSDGVATDVSHDPHATVLPWTSRPPQTVLSKGLHGTREIMGTLPGISSTLRPGVIIQAEPLSSVKQSSSALPSTVFVNVLFTCSAVITASLAGLAIHHRRSPREGDLIFWALRPNLGIQGLEEASSILSALANQIPRDAIGSW